MFNLPKEEEVTEAAKKQGSRGKESEKAVRAWLEKLNRGIAAFDFERVYDARSARGRATARTGDFNVWCNQGYTLEVKEVEHAFRLPRKNFDSKSVAKMVKRRLAGALTLVLVYHKPTKKWRMPALEIFQEEAASWNLSNWPEFEADVLFGKLKEMFLEGLDRG